MFKNMINYIKQVKELKKLLMKFKEVDISSIYWHDLNLNKVISFSGIFKVIIFNLSISKKDNVTSNFNFRNMYSSKPMGDGINTNGARVWNYIGLPNVPWLTNNKITKYLEKHSNELIDEFNKNIDQIDIHPDNKSLTNKKGEWSGIFLYQAAGVKNSSLINLFPKTFEIVEKLKPNKEFGFVLISKITPGTKILPHCGSSNFRHRYHLGLSIPEPKQCKIRVGKDWRYWEQGKSFGFDDSFEHEVEHNGKKDRVVLVIDLWNTGLSDKDVELLSSPIFKTFGNVKI